MEATERKHKRKSCQACRCQILQVNGKEPEQSQQYDVTIENISKGGFRFITSRRYELEDRIKARVFFTDGRAEETTGRICYCNEVEDNDFAYGFSIISGFYSLS